MQEKRQNENKKKPEPDVLKKIDRLNECMQQMEERIISKFRDLSPIVSKNESEERRSSIRENSPFLSSKMSRKCFQTQKTNESKFPVWEGEDWRGRKVQNCRDSPVNWLGGCRQIMMTLGKTECVNYKANHNQYGGCRTPSNGHCLRCRD